MKPDRIKNWPKEERPRERLLAEGVDQLTEAELLAIILRVGQGSFKAGGMSGVSGHGTGTMKRGRDAADCRIPIPIDIQVRNMSDVA